MIKMKIRKAELNDAEIIDKLNRLYLHEKGRNYNEIISSKSAEMFVLELDEEIIGFAGVEYHDWNNSSRIINIFIHPDHRRKGYGTELLQFLIRRLKNKKYRTLIAEAPSLNPSLILYLKNGFRVCGFNDRYYSNKGKEIAVFLSYDFE